VKIGLSSAVIPSNTYWWSSYSHPVQKWFMIPERAEKKTVRDKLSINR
jgi:hypothetical protein